MENDPRLEPVRVAREIMNVIEAIAKEGKRSMELLTAKAAAMAEYDKARGLGTARAKAKGEPVTTIKTIVDGEVEELLFKKIVAEESLKAHYCRMENLRAQLNGLQSINRHLDSI